MTRRGPYIFYKVPVFTCRNSEIEIQGKEISAGSRTLTSIRSHTHRASPGKVLLALGKCGQFEVTLADHFATKGNSVLRFEDLDASASYSHTVNQQMYEIIYAISAAANKLRAHGAVQHHGDSINCCCSLRPLSSPLPLQVCWLDVGCHCRVALAEKFCHTRFRLT